MKKRERQAPAPGPREDDSDVRVLARVLALRFVRASPPREKVSFLKGAGFSQAEIADMLGIDPVTVRVHVHNARKARK